MSVINTNITSMIGQSNLNKSQNALQTSMERLSSGLRINSAKDDSAGQAIANRMTAQITGLAQAQRNANDGISVAQTAEGALNQVNDNLQRIRELSVQAQNDTNSSNDLQSIQDEIGQRLSEINRISEETNFNGVSVLNTEDAVQIQVGANDGETISVNLDVINADTLDLADFDVRQTLDVEVSGPISQVGGDMTDIEALGDIDIGALNLDAGATVTGVYEDNDTPGTYYIEVDSPEAGESGLYAVDSIDNETGEVTVSTGSRIDTAVQGDEGDIVGLDLDGDFDTNAAYDGNVVTLNGEAGYYIEVTDSDTGSENGFYEVSINDETGEVTLQGTPGTPDVAAGTSIDETITSLATPNTIGTQVTEVSGPGAEDVEFATDAVTAGLSPENLVQITAADGSEVYAIQDSEGNLFAADVDEDTGMVTAQSVTFTDGEGNEQTSAVSLGGIDGVTGYVTVGDNNYSAAALDGADLQTDNVEQVALGQTGSPMAALDAALNQVDSLRSELGAVQNRFEDAINNLSTNETNLAAARSRIEDADYAVEVANMTRAQILQQAGTSVLAQANQIPQNVLSLLG